MLKKIKLVLYPENLPIKLVLYVIGVWIITAILNLTMLRLNFEISTSPYFPISVGYVRFDFYGTIFVPLFLLLLYYTLEKYLCKNIFYTYFIGLTLIILSNLAQGDFEKAFISPIAGGEHQYYHDAIKIENWIDWLKTFNMNQTQLGLHTAVHPPGPVLFTKLFMFSDSPTSIAIGHFLISSISIILIYCMFTVIGTTPKFANNMTLLYCLLPAFNIYSLVCIDGVINTFMNFSLLGTLLLLKDNRRLIYIGYGLIAVGLILSSFMTFGTLFLWAVLFVFGIYMMIIHNNAKIINAYAMTFLTSIGIVVLMQVYFNFNYFQSFFAASEHLNHNGFRLFYEPLNYFVTRIESIFEILLFLSLGVLSVIFTHNKISLDNDPFIILSYIALIILSLMFLTGAYHTGETARACLFIYPYILFLLKNVKTPLIISLISFASIQTIVMQKMGNYLW